jgi:hypothetical protein
VIGLEIGTVKLMLVCEPDSLAELISKKYHEYAYDGTPEYIVNIKWSKPSADAVPNHETIDKIDGYYSQGSYVISAPQYSGVINLQSLQTELHYSSSLPIYDFEYFMRIVISHGLYEKGGFLFHSAGIIRDDKAFLFFGKSGSGKTTVTQHSAGLRILSDDLVGVLPAADGVVAYSTPFWNPGWDRHKKAQAKIAGFYRLVKSNFVAEEAIPESLAVSEILSSIPVVPLNEEFCANLIPTIQNFLCQVNAYYLHFRPDDVFWKVIRHGEEIN